MSHISRRTFLHSAGVTGVGLGLLWRDIVRAGTIGASEPPTGPITHWDGSPLGRILLNVMTVYEEPSWRSVHTGFLYYDEVVPVQAAVVGNGLYPTNNTWLQVDGGYIYSSWVQPVDNRPDNAVLDPGTGGLWGTVAVPATWSRYGPSDDAPRHRLMYYGTGHRVTGVSGDYYQITEIFDLQYWIKAGHLQIVPPEALAPLSPDVPPAEKRIEVSIGQQTLRAYEGDQEVFATPISTGMPSTPTPFGEFHVRDKRHAQRMTGGQGEGQYNLPGVPWICYFTVGWVATHGCYWHNDYGRRHSAGCINLHPEAARWIFRWTTPVADYGAFSTETAGTAMPGTRIIVKW